VDWPWGFGDLPLSYGLVYKGVASSRGYL